MINTHTAAATGLVTWVVIDAVRGHVSISGACIGPIVGLVAITPACGFVQPGWSILIGMIATCIVYVLLLLKKYMRFDDTLDVAIVHGCGMYSDSLIRLCDLSNICIIVICRRHRRSIYDWTVFTEMGK